MSTKSDHLEVVLSFEVVHSCDVDLVASRSEKLHEVVHSCEFLHSCDVDLVSISCFRALLGTFPSSVLAIFRARYETSRGGILDFCVSSICNASSKSSCRWQLLKLPGRKSICLLYLYGLGAFQIRVLSSRRVVVFLTAGVLSARKRQKCCLAGQQRRMAD